MSTWCSGSEHVFSLALVLNLNCSFRKKTLQGNRTEIMGPIKINYYRSVYKYFPEGSLLILHTRQHLILWSPLHGGCECTTKDRRCIRLRWVSPHVECALAFGFWPHPYPHGSATLSPAWGGAGGEAMLRPHSWTLGRMRRPFFQRASWRAAEGAASGGPERHALTSLQATHDSSGRLLPVRDNL